MPPQAHAFTLLDSQSERGGYREPVCSRVDVASQTVRLEVKTFQKTGADWKASMGQFRLATVGACVRAKEGGHPSVCEGFPDPAQVILVSTTTAE